MEDRNKYANMSTILRDDITTCEVQFYSSERDNWVDYKTYTYKLTRKLAETLKPKDLVVVDARGVFVVVRIVLIHDDVEICPDSSVKFKWVVCAVDKTEFDTQNKLEELNTEKLINKHRTVLRQKMLNMNGLDEITLLTELPAETEGGK